MTSIGRTIVVGVGLIAVALTASGCGSSDDKSDSTAASTPKQHFTGKPIVLSTMAIIDTPTTTAPEIFSGAKAAARAINAKGGIQGHEVKIDTCNTKSDPNVELACARQAVNEGAVSAVGNESIANNVAVSDTFDKAKLPDLAATSPFPINFQSAMSFPIDFAAGQYAACASPAMTKKTGQNKLAVLYGDNAAGEAQSGLGAQAAFNAGLGMPKIISVPVSQTDFAPVLPKIDATGTTRLIAVLTPSQTPGFLIAARTSGKSYSLCIPDFLTADSLIKSGDAADNVYVTYSLPPTSAAADYPILQRFKKEMKAQEDSGDKHASLDPKTYTALGLRAWLGVQAFEQVASKMKGPINRETFLAALRKSKVDLGVVAPIDFSKPRAKGQYTRVFQAKNGISKWNPDTKQFEVQKDVPPVDGLDAMKN